MYESHLTSRDSMMNKVLISIPSFSQVRCVTLPVFFFLFQEISWTVSEISLSNSWYILDDVYFSLIYTVKSVRWSVSTF